MSGRTYRPTSGLASTLGGLLVVAACTSLLGAITCLVLSSQLGTESALGTAQVIQYSCIAMMPVALLTGVLLLVWEYRSYANLVAFGRDGLRFSPGWAVGSWFVPVAGVFLAKAAINDLYNASSPSVRSGDTSWRGEPSPRRVNGWWLTALSGYGLSFVALAALTAAAEAGDVDGAKAGFAMFALAFVLGARAAAHMRAVIRDITGRQSKLADRLPTAALAADVR